MKKNLAKVYSYLFSKNYKISVTELFMYGFIVHAYWSIEVSESTSMIKFLLTVGVALLSCYASVHLFYKLDLHAKKVQLKYLNKSVNIDKRVEIDVKLAEDVTQEDIERIDEALQKLGELLDKSQ